MRALLTDAAIRDATAYRRFVQAAQTEGLLADHLVEGEPYLALNAIVLEPAEAAELTAIASHCCRAMVRAATIVQSDVAALVAMGFPWAAAELLAAEPPRTPLVGRFDFVLDHDGHWWLLEFNADTPSGFREAGVVDRLVYEQLAEAHGLHQPNSAFAPALRQAFVDALASLPAGSTLGLLTNAAELEDLAQMEYVRRLLAPALESHRIDVILGDLDNVRAARGHLSLRGTRLGALYRCAPFELLFGTPVFAAIAEAVAGRRLRLLNGLFGLLLQHKGLLAWLWEHCRDHRFTPEEQTAIERHLPRTWMIGDAPALHRDLVVKQVFGREGEEVWFSADLTPDAWADLRRRRTYIVQERVRTAQVKAVVPTARGPAIWYGCPTIGAFVIDGQPVGTYTRFGGPITTARAKWLATFVD